MNIVEHKKVTVTRHNIRMDGVISARDIEDFVHQVKRIFEAEKGRPVAFDSDFFVTGDEEGIMASFETERDAGS